jgi:hypothetical protein
VRISLGFAVALTMVLAAMVNFRSALRSGLRGYFALGVGSAYAGAWLALYALNKDEAGDGFLYSSFGLVIGAILQLAHRYRQDADDQILVPLIKRVTGALPRALPPFEFDKVWLSSGIATSLVGFLITVVAPGQQFLAWSAAVVGAFMLLVSTGWFPPQTRLTGRASHPPSA